MNSIFLKVEISNVFAFLIGISIGIVLFFLIYILLILADLKKENKKRKQRQSPLFKKEIAWLIEDCKNEYKNDILREKIGAFNYFKEITFRLVKDIASKYAPESKKPHFELSFDEVLLLSSYIAKRVDELLERKLLKRFRKMTIRKIIDFKNLESSIRNSSIVKGAKLSGADKILKVVQFFNPVNWVKKTVVEPIISKIIFNITLDFIEIIGEEAFHIYSKRVFKTDEELKELDNIQKAEFESLDEIYKDILNQNI